jgi:hypothetical protein
LSYSTNDIPRAAPQAAGDVQMHLAKLTALICAVTGGLYAALGLEPHAFVNLVLSSGPLLAVVLWLEKDVRRTGVAAVHDVGMFLLMGWWIAIPWYSLRTRGGRAGWRLMAVLFGLIAAPYIGAVSAILLLALIRAVTG